MNVVALIPIVLWTAVVVIILAEDFLESLQNKRMMLERILHLAVGVGLGFSLVHLTFLTSG